MYRCSIAFNIYSLCLPAWLLDRQIDRTSESSRALPYHQYIGQYYHCATTINIGVETNTLRKGCIAVLIVWTREWNGRDYQEPLVLSIEIRSQSHQQHPTKVNKSSIDSWERRPVVSRAPAASCIIRRRILVARSHKRPPLPPPALSQCRTPTYAIAVGGSSSLLPQPPPRCCFNVMSFCS